MLETRVPRRRAFQGHFLEQEIRGGRVAGELEGHSPHALEVELRFVLLREERDRPRQEIDRGSGIQALQRANPGLTETLARFARESRIGVGPKQRRLLQVVRDELLDADGPSVEEARDALVNLAAHALGDGAVDDLANEGVLEAEAVLAREGRRLGADESPPDEGHQHTAGLCAGSFGSDRLDRYRQKWRPATAAHSSTRRSSSASLSTRLAISASRVGGSDPAVPSAAKATSCSRKSGLPSAALTVAATACSSSPAEPGSAWIIAPASSAANCPSTIAPSRQSGRASSSSGRATQRRSRGASVHPARYSTRSRNAGGARCTSSRSTTSGCSPALTSRSRRNAQAASLCAPIACWSSSARMRSASGAAATSGSSGPSWRRMSSIGSIAPRSASPRERAVSVVASAA